MNILYYTTDKLHATKGGTERTTITIATALTKQYGCRCFSVYERPADTIKEDCIVEEFLWDQNKYSEKGNIKFLRNIIIRNRINCVIVQGAFILVKKFRIAIEGIDCRLIFAHHFQPKWELVFYKFTNVFHARHQGLKDTLRWIRNVVMYPIFRHNYVNGLSKLYKEAYLNADNVVLLSKGFIIPYKEYGNLVDDEKFVIIPNGLSFNKFITTSEIKKKKRIVLIVARLDEPPKKLSVALNIWKRVKCHPETADWVLKIVGDGPDKKMYQKMISKENIQDVIMLGRQNPIPYYLEASIFMMTSKSESWGLTLTESQQLGVVPIAFNTYESLSDIITNNEDGIIVEPNDFEAYECAILKLMTDPQLREKLAYNGLQSCHRFSPDILADKWWNIINLTSEME